jgi:HD-GYP domain-containing protein (c-di-GMP phosphodiesterase class II)
MVENKEKYIKLIATLNKVGVALSAEKDDKRLLEMILTGAMELTNADGGTLYLLHKKTQLSFALIANKTLNIQPSRINKSELNITAISLYNIHGEPNLKNVACFCFHENKTVHIEDAYHTKGFDFSGTRHADQELGYHSKSFLTIPLRDHENVTIGVLQLINAMDDETGEIIPFPEERIVVAESLASQAAITLTKQELILAQKKLFDALLHFIAKAIDEKSRYTSNHCTRVPILTMMIATAMNQVMDGPLKDYRLSQDQFEELSIAAWLHDCGKIITPEHVMNKSTKLETLCDRIEVIITRLEIMKRDVKIEYLEALLNADTDSAIILEKNYKEQIDFLNQSQAFLIKANVGGEELSVNDKQQIQILSQYTYVEGSQAKPLLSETDIENLSISRGTLNDKERKIIENHVTVTQLMLQSLPYPEHLKNVPDIAGSHHERMNGKGYPRGINKEKLSIQARILTIADIFEALTSVDRPYKKTKTLKEVLHIMENMKNDGHIDPDLYALFIKDKIYLNYAKKYLSPEQIDV